MLLLRRILKIFIWTLFCFLLIVALAVSAITYYLNTKLPDVKVLNDVRMQVPLSIYSKEGELIARYGTKRRIPVTLDQVPKLLTQAVLATEDSRYYSHSGVDFIGLFRAAKAVMSSGRKIQGASTITMQVARSFFLTHKKTYSRKIKEILLALKIDKELSKEKVLELYLNEIYFGNRAYGVAAAAQVYYGKKLYQLTLPEMAMIAGLPQAPSRNNPLKNPRAALLRRNHVLRRMYEVGYINYATYKKAVAAPLTAAYHVQTVSLYAPYVAEMVRQMVVSLYGNSAYERGLHVYTTISAPLQRAADQSLQEGLLVYSKRHGWRRSAVNLGVPSLKNLQQWQDYLAKLPLVAGKQAAAVLRVDPQSFQAFLADGEVITVDWPGMSWARPVNDDGSMGASPRQASDIVKVGDLIWLDETDDQQWQLTQIPLVQGALVSMNAQSGAILAISGGFDYAISNFNRATQAKRQPGSNFKPFIYSAALEKGYTLATIINDAPIVIRDPGENELWRPQNDKEESFGLTRLRLGLTKSINLISIRILQRIGLSYTLKYISRFGFDPAELPQSLSLALGSGVMNPMQIASGYAVFANGGYRVDPHIISQITIVNQDSPKGKVVYEAQPKLACPACIANPNLPLKQQPQPAATRVISPQNAYLINLALKDVILSGTGRQALELKRNDLAGKTGTTNEKIDAWFSGFNEDIVTTVWVGFDNHRSLNEYGAQSALPIWINFMRVALSGKPEHSLEQPPGIVFTRINKNDGLLASPRDPNAILEAFRQDTVPKRFSSGGTQYRAKGSRGSGRSRHLF